jgi:hypothetical protein
MRRFVLPVFLMVVTMAGLARSQRTAGNETDTVEDNSVLTFNLKFRLSRDATRS